MRFSAIAGVFAPALSLAVALTEIRITKRIPAFGVVRLSTNDNTIAIDLNNGDAQITLQVEATIEESGEAAVDAERLAKLIAGFPKDNIITITSDATMVTIASECSKFKLPTISFSELPTLALVDEIGRATISHADARKLFVLPAFAISRKVTRYVLSGILLHDHDGDLAACSTDEHRLVRAIVGGAAGLSQDQRCIVPLFAAKAIAKLFGAHRDVGEIVLRRSRTLIEISSDSARLTSKLVDGIYPDYARAISRGGGNTNTVTVDRRALLAACARVGAVAGEGAVVGLAWGPEQDGLHLCAARHIGIADDVIKATTRGAGWIAFKASHADEAIGVFDSDTITIDAGDEPGAPIWISGGPGPGEFLVVQMQIVVPVQQEVTA